MSSPTPPGQPPQPPHVPPPQPPYKQAPPQPPYQQYPQQMPPAPKKGGGALKWILIGVGFLVLCIVLFVGASLYFVSRVIKNAGFDPELMRRNPGLALARMAT